MLYQRISARALPEVTVHMPCPSHRVAAIFCSGRTFLPKKGNCFHCHLRSAMPPRSDPIPYAITAPPPRNTHPHSGTKDLRGDGAVGDWPAGALRMGTRGGTKTGCRRVLV